MRRGVEAKPAWAELPGEMRRAVERALGAEVRRAQRVWGGYAPTPTFRLRLADGRRAFCKAVGPADNEFSRQALGREERVYRELGELIRPWAPNCYGALHVGDWQALLLEDLGPKSVPPWTPAAARGVARGFAEFHQSTLGRPLPPWLPSPERYVLGMATSWERLAEGGDLAAVTALAGGRAEEARRWLDGALPALSAASAGLVAAGPPHAFLHGDVRSDNLRWSDGGLRLFDWPHVGTGPAEFDLAAFAQSVTVEGGAEPERVTAWYAERSPLRAEVLDAAVAAVAGFFADAAPRPEVPGLPRLRGFQRAQLRVSLAWAARRLRLPPPAWLGGVGT